MKLIELGQIVSTHGTRGQVRINPWCDTPEFFCNFKTVYIAGRALKCSARPHGNIVIATLEGIETVNAAAALKGQVVSGDRSGMVLEEGRYFISDLIGLKALDQNGNEIGSISDVLNMPAQDVWQITGEKKYLVPAVEAFVECVDIEGGFVRLKMIDGLEM